MNKKVVTFGEIMLRLSTKGFSRFIQAQNFDVTFGGGEANVSVALANFGLNSFFVTALPNHEIGQSAVNHLRRFGVNTNSISRKGDRIGIYFLETGASQRASKVIYDRANSAIANVERKDFDWENILENCTWFHWTGITPAIGKNVQLVLKDALETAKSKKIKVSCDLNFRKKMWSTEEAQKVMIPLMEYVDVCIANEEDAEKSLGEKLGKTQIEKAAIDEDGYFKTAELLKNKYDFEAVAITLRESFSASRNGWSAILLDNKNCKSPYRSKKYDIQIVDRVGGGDSFASGLIYGLLNYENTKNALEFAVGASCLKQTIPGDFNLVTVDEVEKLIKGDGSGRVER
ncbi:MAG: sugar kinase [Ignavibacteriae bacterium]|nr:sugar kinase [Ignavibacteriota bacterium]